MYTSCFAHIKNIPAGLEPVAISRGIPRFFKGRRCLDLAPSRELLDADLPWEEYVKQYKKTVLKDLDPGEIAEVLGDNAVMLCWEGPGKNCHRRLVAEWLEKALKIKVPELGK